MNRGKEKCEFLRKVRRQVAEQYGLTYNEHECHHEGDCAGVCPLCDAELEDLQRQLREKGVDDINLFEELNGGMPYNNIIDEPEPLGGVPVMQGDPYPPYDGEMMKPMPICRIHRVVTPSRKLLKKCYVAGLQFHDAVDFALELSEGDRLFLIREQCNEHDSNAVAVAFCDDYDEDTVVPDEFSVIGYIPRTENSEIATMLDMGWANILECEVSKVNEKGSWSNRLEVAIYIKNNTTQAPDSEGLRVMIVRDDEFDQMRLSLFDQGFVYFRWGGFPTWECNLPKKGEQILALNEQRQSFNAVLLNVLAVNEGVIPFVGREEIDIDDDCIPFILSAVSGPTKLSGDVAKELRKKEIHTWIPETFLKEDIVEKIMASFAKTWR